jgi:hypothetical protein
MKARPPVTETRLSHQENANSQWNRGLPAGAGIRTIRNEWSLKALQKRQRTQETRQTLRKLKKSADQLSHFFRGKLLNALRLNTLLLNVLLGLLEAYFPIRDLQFGRQNHGKRGFPTTATQSLPAEYSALGCLPSHCATWHSLSPPSPYRNSRRRSHDCRPSAPQSPALLRS